MQGFRDAEEQRTCRRNIYNMGMTVSGFARKYGFNRNTVVNIMYREAGISNNLTGIGKEIMGKIRDEGMI